MQQADTAGSTRPGTASPGNPFRFSRVSVNLILESDGPLLARNMTASTTTRMQEVDQRIDNLKAFVSLVIGSEDLDDHANKAMGHIWQSLDDMRVLTSEMVNAERVS